MGFVFTILYIGLAYFSPAYWFPELIHYRVQLCVAVLALLCSIPALPGSRILRHPQTYAIAGLVVAAGLSQIANGWFGGALLAFQNLLPHVIVFYLLVINCRTVRRFKIVVLVLAVTAIVSITLGETALAQGQGESAFLMSQRLDSGQYLSRIRGLGFVNDPNDLAQLLVTVLALLPLLVPKGQRILQTFVVVPTAAFLIYGVYLTHSRGALIGLALIALVSLRQRFGTIPALVTTGILLAVFLAAGFSGGRSISADAGSDRMAAWGAGLQFFKAKPIFGIGYNNFADNYEITAHNSFVLCLAELGTVGYALWIAILVFSFSYLNRVVSSSIKPTPMRQEHDCSGQKDETTDAVAEQGCDGSPDEVKRLARIVRTALIAFLATAWFLSRAYVMNLFILVGLTAVVYTMSEPLVVPRTVGLKRLAFITAAFMFGSVTFLYAALRLRVFL